MALGGLDQSSVSNERPPSKPSASLAPLRLGGNPPETNVRADNVRADVLFVVDDDVWTSSTMTSGRVDDDVWTSSLERTAAITATVS